MHFYSPGGELSLRVGKQRSRWLLKRLAGDMTAAQGRPRRNTDNTTQNTGLSGWRLGTSTRSWATLPRSLFCCRQINPLMQWHQRKLKENSAQFSPQTHPSLTFGLFGSLWWYNLFSPPIFIYFWKDYYQTNNIAELYPLKLHNSFFLPAYHLHLFVSCFYNITVFQYICPKFLHQASMYYAEEK